jgi:hypothetical protein
LGPSKENRSSRKEPPGEPSPAVLALDWGARHAINAPDQWSWMHAVDASGREGRHASCIKRAAPMQSTHAINIP